MRTVDVPAGGDVEACLRAAGGDALAPGCFAFGDMPEGPVLFRSERGPAALVAGRGRDRVVEPTAALGSEPGAPHAWLFEEGGGVVVQLADPRDSRPWTLRFEGLRRLGAWGAGEAVDVRVTNTAQELRALHRSTAVGPGLRAAYERIATMGDFERAEEESADLALRHPTPEVLNLHGVIAMRRHDHEEAQRRFERALQLGAEGRVLDTVNANLARARLASAEASRKQLVARPYHSYVPPR